MLGVYPDIGHSSVLELKYRQCGAHPGHTPVHRLVLVWLGMDLVVAKEL